LSEVLKNCVKVNYLAVVGNKSAEKKEYGTKNLGQAKESQTGYYLKNLDKIKESKKEYRNNNKDKIKEGKKEYRAKNLGNIKESKQVYYLNNRDIVKENQKVYYKKNQVHIKESKKEYYQKFKDKIKENEKEIRIQKNPTYTPYTYSWKSREQSRNNLESIASILHITDLSDWYRISLDQILQLGGSHMNNSLQYMIYLLLYSLSMPTIHYKI
jgi:hypothetical protein